MAITQETKRAIEELIDALCALQPTTGRRNRKLAEMFLELPPREDYPDYYQAIPEPRCINGIRASLAKGKYKTAEDVYDELVLVMLNAEFYNEEASQIHQDAKTLKAFIETTWKSKSNLPAPRTTPNPSSPRRRPTGGSGKITIPPVAKPAAASTSASSAGATHTPQMTVRFTQPIQAKPSPLSQNVHISLPNPPASVTRASAAAATQQSNSASVASTSTAYVRSTLSQSILPEQDEKEDLPFNGALTGPEAEEIINRLVRTLPRWKGPSEEGWSEELAASLTPQKVLELVKSFRIKHNKLPSEALVNVTQHTIASPQSFADLIKQTNDQPFSTVKEFDITMSRFFEKCRSHHAYGTTEYGYVLICQRLYQQLVSPKPPSLPPHSQKYFSSVSAGPGHNPAKAAEKDDISKLEKTPVSEVAFKGVTYKAGYWVHLINPDEPFLPIVGQIHKTWLRSDGVDAGTGAGAGVTVSWYCVPEQTVHPEARKFWEREVFHIGHQADHFVEDILEPICVQHLEQASVGRPRGPHWYPNWPLYICESRYDEKEKVFSKIDNWETVLPKIVSSKTGKQKSLPATPIYAFEQLAVPKKLESPFQRGMVGPGSVVEDLEGRKRTRRGVDHSRGIGEASGSTSSVSGTASATGTVTGQNQPGYQYYTQQTARGGTTSTVPVTSGTTRSGGKVVDRSVVIAAGGVRNILYSEKLSPELAKLFDRDPVTNQVLWFPGPPIDIPRPRAPRYSLEYLHFLAKKERLKRKREGDEDEEEDDGGDDGESGGGSGSGGGEEGVEGDVEMNDEKIVGEVIGKTWNERFDEAWYLFDGDEILKNLEAQSQAQAMAMEGVQRAV